MSDSAGGAEQCPTINANGLTVLFDNTSAGGTGVESVDFRATLKLSSGEARADWDTVLSSFMVSMAIQSGHGHTVKGFTGPGNFEHT
jgi:hypothetical protein